MATAGWSSEFFIVIDRQVLVEHMILCRLHSQEDGKTRHIPLDQALFQLVAEVLLEKLHHSCNSIPESVLISQTLCYEMLTSD